FAVLNRSLFRNRLPFELGNDFELSFVSLNVILMYVRIVFVRHGVSCANEVKEYGKTMKLLHALYPDPELSRAGRELTLINGKSLLAALRRQNIVIDFFGSSSLMRAIETAAIIAADTGCQFKVFPLPYLAEKGATPDNMPLSVDEQMRVLSLPSEVDFSFCNGRTPGRSASNYDKFLGWLSVPKNLKAVLAQAEGPRCPPAIASQRKIVALQGPQVEATLLLAVHSNLLKSMGAKDTPNNAAFVQVLSFDGDRLTGKSELKPVPYPLETAHAPTCPSSCRRMPVCD
ncbi:MAG: hypothetical protein ACYCOU_18315, partial [Sulfobacillus sp.]